MVYTDTDILKERKRGLLDIIPFNASQLGSNSYDLRLGKDLLIYTGSVLDAAKDNPIERFQIPEEGIVLQPGELYLGVTVERTWSKSAMPMLEGKSSVGRLGICIHITAGFGDVGFNGHWTLEITAVKPVRIYANMPIAQIAFYSVLSNCTTPYSLKGNSKYQNQPALPIPSKMFMNFERITNQ